MIKRYGRKFKNKRTVRKHIAKRITSWDSIIKSAPDKKTRELCLSFKNYWERKLKKLR